MSGQIEAVVAAVDELRAGGEIAGFGLADAALDA
jgi:hypothetical protein